MDIDHSTLVWISKSFGLFYLVGLSLIIVIYVYWPSNKRSFDHAAESIFRNKDKP